MAYSLIHGSAVLVKCWLFTYSFSHSCGAAFIFFNSFLIGCYFHSCDTLPAVRAINSPVGTGSKSRTAHTTTAHILCMVKLGVQLLICGQYRDTEPFTEQGIGNKLRAYASVPVVKQDTVSAIIIAACPAYKGVDFPALGRREPLNVAHTSNP